MWWLMAYTNNSTVTTYDVQSTGSEWRFNAVYIFSVESLCTVIVNIVAFAIIYRSRKSFDRNGFWEQLLVLCVSDSLSGLCLFFFTLLQIEDLRHNKLFVRIVGLLYIFFQMSSYGNTLGISIQRFLAVQKADTRQRIWTRKSTLLFCVGNFLMILSLLVLFLVLRTVLSETQSLLAFVLEIGICVLLIDMFCYLTVHDLRRKLKVVGAGGTGQYSKGKRAVRPTNIATVCTVLNNSEIEKDRFGASTFQDITESLSFRITSVDHNEDVKDKIQTSKDENAIIETIFEESGQSLNFLKKQNKILETSGSNLYPKPNRQLHTNNVTSLPGPTFHGHPRKTKRIRFGQYQRDVVLTIAIVVLLLNIFTFVPVVVSIILRVYPNPENLATYRSIILCMTINSLINPFVYIFRMSSLKARITRSLRLLCKRH